jgi:hypothetical protein
VVKNDISGVPMGVAAFAPISIIPINPHNMRNTFALSINVVYHTFIF